MRAADKPEFQRLLTDVMAFYRQDVSTFALSVWWQACEGFDIEQVRKALTAHAMDPERGQFAPRPADLVRALHGTHGDRSLMAWSKVHRAMSAVGAYRSVVFDDPAIHAAVQDMGGWVSLCRSRVDELPFVQRRFCDAYRAYLLRPGHDYPRVLQGDLDAHNAVRGFDCEAPARIGDPERCARVLNGARQALPA